MRSLGVLLFNMMSNRYPYSSDINLMDTDVWIEPGFSDGKNLILIMQNRENSSFINNGLLDNAGISHSLESRCEGNNQKFL